MAPKNDALKEQIDSNFSELAAAIAAIKTPQEAEQFLSELCTQAECRDLAIRWALMKELLSGTTQRAIAAKYHTSLCKITRGVQYAKNPNSILRKAVEASGIEN